MTSATLSPDWENWRQTRRAEFLSSGMTFSSADEVSRAEAAARQKVELHTDLRTALAASLAVVPDEHGEDRVVLLVPPELIPAANRRDAEHSLHVTGFAVRL